MYICGFGFQWLSIFFLNWENDSCLVKQQLHECNFIWYSVDIVCVCVRGVCVFMYAETRRENELTCNFFTF